MGDTITNARNITYLNKDFTQYRSSLIEYIKTYFPKVYADFNETSPGMMFIELAAYVGDVLSYYIDDTLKESMLMHANDIDNIIPLAYYLGYKPKLASPAIVKLSVYQLVPATGSGIDNRIDDRFLLRIKEGMNVQSDSGINFVTQDVIDFSDTFEREVNVYQIDDVTKEPVFYLVRKYVNAISAEVRTTTRQFGDYQPNANIIINDSNIISVIDVIDSNNNRYYEVPYLAQDTIFTTVPNSERYDIELAQFKESVPFILKLLKTPRRFVTRVTSDNNLTLNFGTADSTVFNEQLIPTTKNVGLGLPYSIDRLEQSYDPTNFLKTNTYGISPSNTTLTVKYLVGGGVESNVGTGTITSLSSIEFYDSDVQFSNQDKNILNSIKDSIAIENESPASGGGTSDTIETIRENALAMFNSQNRAVTAGDYQVRVLSMPSIFGNVAKVYAIADSGLDTNSPYSILSSTDTLLQFSDLARNLISMNKSEDLKEDEIEMFLRDFIRDKKTTSLNLTNPLAINLYILGMDDSGHLTSIVNNKALVNNIRTYLTEHRMLTDGVSVMDGHIINIGVNFDVIVANNFNKAEVLTNCIIELKDYFDIDKWGFNQPINIGEIELLLSNVDGVNTITKVEIVNKTLGGYSPYSYDIISATKNKIVYPSLDPCVFEVKFPDNDILGRAL